MQENKIMKRDIILLVVCVLVLVSLIGGFSYAYFTSIDKGQSNIISIGDLKVSFCVDETCKKDYANFGQVIGTKMVDGKSVIESIYPYEFDSDALKKDPYVFNIKNTGSLKTYVTIRLKEDKDYTPSAEYSDYESLTTNYKDNIKIAVSDCNNKINTEEVTIKKYTELEDNIILNNEVFESGKDKTYCLWTYLDKDTPNEVQNTYFVANLDFSAEYKPYSE